MYNTDKLRKGYDLDVKDLINELLLEDPYAKITICGNDEFYIHTDEYGNINIDTEPLYDNYDESVDELIEICKVVDKDTYHLENNPLVKNTIEGLNKLGYIVMVP